MSHLLPRSPSVDPPEQDAAVVGFDDPESDAVFSALASEIARSILVRLYESPATQSELADAADTSLQNVTYHLDNLEEAGLVAVVGEWYSEKGAEMDVYGPASESLVIVAGDPETLEDGH